MNPRALQDRCKSRGLAMVETAIVLPVFLVLLLATAEFGRAFLQYNALTKAARDGARFAAGEGLFGSTGVVIITDRVRSDVLNLVVYGNAAGSGSPILPGMSTSDVTLESPGDGDVLVRAGYTYDPLFAVLPRFQSGSLSALYEFEAVVRMRAL